MPHLRTDELENYRNAVQYLAGTVYDGILLLSCSMQLLHITIIYIGV